MKTFANRAVTTLSMVATLATGLPAGSAPIAVGERAPEFSLAATVGGEIRLSDYRDKKIVLIEFYHADFGPT